VIAVHPADAASRGLEPGALVLVHNQRGEFTARVEITGRTRPGVASMTKGHWPKLAGGPTVNATTFEDDADMARGATFHDNQVVLTPVAGAEPRVPPHSEATR
jgi:anaerobic selenocysteine-containing dehydrogenase